MNGDQIHDKTRYDKTERLAGHFTVQDGVLYYDSKICVPRKNVKDILMIAHHNKKAGHFGY